MSQRLASTTCAPPVPPHFVRHFVQGGWRRVERIYGCRTSLMLAWIDMSGGLDELQEQRRAWRAMMVVEARKG